MKPVADLFRVLSARRNCLSLAVALALGATASGETLQDPTRPPDARSTAHSTDAAGLQLEGIVDTGERRVAIVNGHLVRPGDRIGATRIDEIGVDSIRYTRNGLSAISRISKPGVPVRSPARATETGHDEQ